ncbi:GNAT family N-acetyltransferase [Nitrosopumilus sp.]|uniref:GNAT family N-acetyltransferase n=1 Tax=Nitrosopumilus sp. TaxID=2024843 RepID=UPI00247EF41A|nr:GNAT family N-acetyltransferase [Nitrosopumilus sp.]MCV0430375.1 GNAT family N-acetyltransferase [Nitrosopumilus sp.]
MNIELVPVKRENWDIILELRNEFFQMFYKQTKPIQKDEHYAYLTENEKNQNFHHWMIKFNKKTVGYVRILNEDVGIMIKKEYQSKGIATKALELVEKEAKKESIKKLIALVKIENEESKKIFEKNNFKMKMFWYEKDIS